ncbi:hypothetical protein M2262_002459 [Pseudomonas sp. BIGb0408]|uniref:Uncharacterized protein n=1 Tax=Phytopseudomonas flavescens TaxID=29435 RepID=A0A7Y9XKF0_9GAMM|nr:hypothetical protein [Pseudomonas sp. BIGb0408]NYH73020.1 hypothetical protein [Pseudomonas flavescens]
MAVNNPDYSANDHESAFKAGHKGDQPSLKPRTG